MQRNCLSGERLPEREREANFISGRKNIGSVLHSNLNGLRKPYDTKQAVVFLPPLFFVIRAKP